jgi:hypothetical protein
MVIFIERFLMAILATVAVLLGVTNPMGVGVAARIVGCIVIFVLAAIAALFAERVQQQRCGKRIRRAPISRLSNPSLKSFKFSLRGCRHTGG